MSTREIKSKHTIYASLFAAEQVQATSEVTLFFLSTSTKAQCYHNFSILLLSLASLAYSLMLIEKCCAELSDIHDIQCCAKVFHFKI